MNWLNSGARKTGKVSGYYTCNLISLTKIVILMKKKIRVLLVLSRSVVCFMAVILLGISGASAQSFKLSGVSDLVRVFEDGYNLPEMFETVEIMGIRGEIISGQVVVEARKNLTDIEVEVSELDDRANGNVLAASDIDWNFVGTVHLSQNTSNQPPNLLIRPAPAMIPEYLMAERQTDIPRGTFRAVWLTIRIPVSAKAGNYSGRVTVRCPQGEESIPLNLTVYPFTMPEERHLKVVEWHSTSEFRRFHGIEEEYSPAWFSMLATYAENMVAHRQNVFRVPLTTVEVIRKEGGELAFDFTLFDRIAEVFWNTGKMDCLETGFLTKFGEGDWFSTEILLKDIPVKDGAGGDPVTLSGHEVVPDMLQALESHLRQKGWLGKTLFHVKDEPSIHNALAWMEMSEYVHRYAPDLRRIDAIETSYLLDEIEVAVPKLDELGAWYGSFRRWQEEGNELWFYTVGIYQGSYFPNKTIDVPVIDSRIMHWLNYRFEVPGYLHWGWNRWNEDPYSETGMHIGDGWHVYPVRDGVLNSLRWEQMRNGLQDYEYFWLLEEKVRALKDSLGSRFEWIDPKSRGKEIAGQVVTTLAEHTYDPQVLYDAKREVIGELLEFDTSPRIYFQTDPPENTAMTNRSSVAVMGWTEPGTKIVVNGKQLPVSEQGMFLEQFHLYPYSPDIRVEAIGTDGSKELIRKFEVNY